MKKISLSWLFIVILKLTNQEIKSDTIISFQEAYELCEIEPSADICNILENSSRLIDLNYLEMPEKRRQKTVFSSWGGKRQNTYPYWGKRPAFSSWGGKRSMDKNVRTKQTFSSWGGKRNEIDSYNEQHQMEKRELNDFKNEDKKNYQNKVTKGIHALFTMFSDWSKEPDKKKEFRFTGVKGLRRSSDFFSWGGKRSNMNIE
ncbi:uncharacterized protein LOC126907811 [Daktulosphaira vitifoliae]|uniref:uncharacterized protein LOC126907811 n=1 Tax=Daktulosphaira vitifoliae TaxID=58002 RepID=UPI0021A988F4|nr:uncharacterized protein LOC126907811 [Daktulosphaira vitifoliae]XP_050545373.1 uncharacterized protein LOC126907811 [Daktulosphaira vitifoliae]